MAKDVLIKPLITEKMSNLTEKKNLVGFIVDNSANKLEIRKAIENMYGVSVLSVKTMNYPAKARQRHTKTGVTKGKTNTYKKAIVKLVEGDTIDFFSNI